MTPPGSGRLATLVLAVAALGLVGAILLVTPGDEERRPRRDRLETFSSPPRSEPPPDAVIEVALLAGAWIQLRGRVCPGRVEAAAWCEEVARLIEALSDRAVAEQVAGMAELQARQRALLGEARARTGWLDAEGAAAQAARIEALLAQ